MIETTKCFSSARIAVLIPCTNEEKTITKVVGDFRRSLPRAAIYVYDNNSKDSTVELARAAGAIVRFEAIQGKGHVVRRMFADIDADVYVLVDGDDTYDATSSPKMIALLLGDQLDMVSGVRVPEKEAAYRPGHRFGNSALSSLVAAFFGNRITDVLSGYRVFSRRFVKSFPALASGFETETEFTVHALELSMPVTEVHTRYKERPAGSLSKLRTYSDGFRIACAILILVKEVRPLQFFSIFAAALFFAGIAFGIPVVSEYLRTGLVPRLPTAVLSTGLVLLSSLSLVCGLVLDSVARGRREQKRLAYLMVPAFTINNPAELTASTPKLIPTSQCQLDKALIGIGELGKEVLPTLSR